MHDQGSPIEHLGGLPGNHVENNQQHTCNKEQRAEQRAQQFHAPQLLGFVSNGKDFELLRNQEYLICRDPLTEDKPSSGHQHENYAFTQSHPQDDLSVRPSRSRTVPLVHPVLQISYLEGVRLPIPQRAPLDSALWTHPSWREFSLSFLMPVFVQRDGGSAETPRRQRAAR